MKLSIGTRVVVTTDGYRYAKKGDHGEVVGYYAGGFIGVRIDGDQLDDVLITPENLEIDVLGELSNL